LHVRSHPAALQKLDKSNRSNAIHACVKEVESQMAKDQKTTGLKALQGLIWHDAYSSGAIQAEIFPDVPHALESFSASGIKTYIYSSGSRQAQADFFGHAVVCASIPLCLLLLVDLDRNRICIGAPQRMLCQKCTESFQLHSILFVCLFSHNLIMLTVLFVIFLVH
jgi:methionine salvage enolase-phosphatase E1